MAESGLCRICLCAMREPSLSACGHGFCFGCIMKSLASSKSCPVCRAALDASQVSPTPPAAAQNGTAALPHITQLQRALSEEGAKLTSREIDSLLNVLISKKKSLENSRRQEHLDLLRGFLARTKTEREELLRRVQLEVQVIAQDLQTVESELRGLAGTKQDTLALPWADDVEDPSTDAGHEGADDDVSVPGDNPKKRKRERGDEEADAERQVPAKAPAVIVASDVAEGPTPRAPKPQPTQQTLQLLDRIQKHQTDLEDGYFSLRIKDGGRLRGSQADLEGFGAELTKIASKHRFRTVANLHYADSLLGAQNSIVSSIVFDKDDEFFATAGVTKKIKIFEFSGLADMEGVDDVSDQQAPRIRSTLRRMAALAPGEGPAAENGDGKEQDNIPIYPTREIQCRSKISSLSWNSFIKSHLASADYEGCVTLWDSNVGAVVAQFDEHEKRTWSVDFCKNDPVKLASGSDDAKVKIWVTNMKNSVCTIEGRANVCSVKFNPEVAHQVAFGSADHSIHLYDVRNVNKPLHVFRGHRKAVSYVQFRSSNEMVTASTDGTLKIWDVAESIREDASTVVRTFTGHSNERNFVGLSVSSDGEFLACGSETNAVYVYHRKVRSPLLTHRFGPALNALTGEPAADDDASQFVSSVSWTRKLPGYLVCANSVGRLKVLQMLD